MKKIGSFFSVLTTLAVLVGCNSNNLSDVQPIQAQQDTTQIKSMQGATYAYKFMVKQTFTMIDKNKDGYVSLEEFKAAHTPPPTPTPAPAGDQPTPTDKAKSIDDLVPSIEKLGEDPAPTPSVAPVDPSPTPVTSATPKPVTPLTPEQLFKKIDKNKDGKISITEAQNSKYFLGGSISDIRKSVTQFYYRGAFKYSNGRYTGTITKDQFMSFVGGSTSSEYAQVLNTAFYAADRNFDGKLNFSEAEDLIYSMMRATYNPVNPPSPPTPPSPIEPTAVPSDAPQPAPSDLPNPAPVDPSVAPSA